MLCSFLVSADPRYPKLSRRASNAFDSVVPRGVWVVLFSYMKTQRAFWSAVGIVPFERKSWISGDTFREVGGSFVDAVVASRVVVGVVIFRSLEVAINVERRRV